MIDTSNLYDVRVELFDNGAYSMVEIRGLCRADGVHVRYHQQWEYFALRVHLYRQDHPDTDVRDAIAACASMACDQYRRSWMYSQKGQTT